MYFKMTFTNGYCGCDEVEYVELENLKEADDYFNEAIYNYGFFEPDARFVDPEDYETEDDYQVAIEDYQDDIFGNSWYEEVTKEEYEENE